MMFFDQIWFLLLLSTPGYVAASVWLTRYALTGSYAALAVSLTLYFGCNLIFARIIALGGLASAYAMSAAATMIGVVAAAALLQNENLTNAKVAGVCAALAAIVLFALPESGVKS